MSQEQLAAERRFGRVAAAAAVLAALALYVGGFWTQAIRADSPENNDPAELRYMDRHSGEILASALVQAAGMLLLAVVALHLYRALKARRPDEPPVVLVMGIYGPVALAVVTIARAVALAVIAGDFADRTAQTLEAADDALNDPALLIPQYVGISAALGLAFWLVKGSLDAMRIGLLTRFMGVIGIVVGVTFVLPLGLGSLLLPLWLFALAALFLGRWPGGVPPAWESGQAVPWDSGADRRQVASAGEEPANPAAGAGRDGEVDAVGPGVRRAGRGPRRNRRAGGG
jgi:hypothetical protein